MNFARSFLFSFCALYAGTSLAGFRDFVSGASTWEEPEKISNLSEGVKALIRATLKDIPGVIDSHLHLICREEKNSCFVPKKLFSPKDHPFSAFKTQILLSALGITNDEEPDAQYFQRLDKVIRNFPLKPYIAMLFAYTATYDRETGKKLPEKTGLEVSNSYMMQVVSQAPRSLIPVYSLHPFQAALEKEFAKLKKPRLFKVLPNSMHFSPDDEKCSKFFELLSANNSILITHIGDEHSIEGGGIDNDLGNPLLYEKWLKRFPKLRIIFAHTGGSGRSRVNEKDKEENFHLVLQLMRKYPKQTYADISAFALAPNITKHLPELVQATDLHSRLLYGSDYPLAAIKPLMNATLYGMYWKGLLGGWRTFKERYDILLEIYNYNPLLASVVTMRLVSFKDKRFAPEVFYENTWRLLSEDFDFSRTLNGVNL